MHRTTWKHHAQSAGCTPDLPLTAATGKLWSCGCCARPQQNVPEWAADYITGGPLQLLRFYLHLLLPVAALLLWVSRGHGQGPCWGQSS